MYVRFVVTKSNCIHQWLDPSRFNRHKQDLFPLEPTFRSAGFAEKVIAWAGDVTIIGGRHEAA